MLYNLLLIITIAIILIMVIFLLFSWGFIKSPKKTNNPNFTSFWILPFMMLQSIMLQSIIDTKNELRREPFTWSRIYQFTAYHKPFQGVIERIQNACLTRSVLYV